MYTHWSPMQSNGSQINTMSQQSFNQGFFQYPNMWQQQQSQFVYPNFVHFPAFIPPSPPQSSIPPPYFTPHPNNLNADVKILNNGPPDYSYMSTENNYSSSEPYRSQSVYSSEKKEKNNQVNYERNHSQEYYTSSYPGGAIYRRVSGPGWQRQEVFYPATPLEWELDFFF